MSNLMLLLVASYFLLVCAALALWLLPSVRAWARRQTRGLLHGSRSASQSAAQAGQQGWSKAQSALADAGASTRGWSGRNARWLALTAAVLLAPTMLAVSLRGCVEINGYDHTASHEVNAQVAALLRGEQLVPPPALPPEVFMTVEVDRARPLIRYANRKWELLDEDFRRRLLVAYKLMREQHGYEMVLLEGFRSPERQAQLAGLGSHVTRAGAYESYHQYGLAADSAFQRGGEIVIRETDPWAMRGYELFGEVARSVGLVWGGGWSLKDYGHAELRRPGTLKNKGDNGAPATAQEQ